jgi:phosphohistidine phosphatase
MRLWVIRHAKSDWSTPGQSDFERPLNDRGRRDGPRMATWLRRQAEPATWIWSSDAVRAQRTAAFVAQGFAAASPQLVLEHRLYLAGFEQLAAVLRTTPDTVSSVAIVAHNPGLTDLVNALAGEQVIDNLPTFGIATFEVSGAWHELRASTARYRSLMNPKRLPGNG